MKNYSPTVLQEGPGMFYGPLMISVGVIGLVLVTLTILVFVRNRKSLFSDPIYDIWLAYLATRIVKNFLTLTYVGEYLPHWFRNTLFCQQLLGYVKVVQLKYAAILSLMLCLYQGFVLFCPVKFFLCRNSFWLRKYIRICLAISVLYPVAAGSVFFSNFHLPQCYLLIQIDANPATGRMLLPPIPQTYADGILLVYFLLQIFTAILYLLIGIATILKRKDVEKLKGHQQDVIKAQRTMSIIGMMSFFSSFVVNFWAVYTPELLFTPIFFILTPIFMFVDQCGDPFFFYWRNSTFREHVNRLTVNRLFGNTARTDALISQP